MCRVRPGIHLSEISHICVTLENLKPLNMFSTDLKAIPLIKPLPSPFLSLSPLPSSRALCLCLPNQESERERERDSHRPRNPAKLEKTEEKPESHLYIHSFGKIPLPFSLIFRIGFLGFSVKLEGIEPNLRIHVFVVH